MKRKLMAFSLAMAMTVSSASMAFGATTTIKDSTGTPLADGVSSETVTGDATINYVDKDITIVDLPTVKPDFVLDPQGLYGAVNSDAYVAAGTDDEKKAALNAEAKNHVGEVSGKDVLQITNRGANKIKVEATFVATSTAKEGATNTPKFVATDAEVDNTNTDNTINLEVALANASLAGAVATPATTANGEPTFVKKAPATPAGDKTETVFAASATAKTAFTNAGKTVSFLLAGDDTYGYTVTGVAGSEVYGYDAGTVAGVTATTVGQKSPTAQALYISGKMNDKADWSSYATADPDNKVGVKVIYSVSKASDTDTAADAGSGFIAATDIAGGKVTATGTTAGATITFTKSTVSDATLAEYIKINNFVLTDDSDWSRGVLGSVDSSTGTITLTARGLDLAGVTGPNTYPVEVKDSNGDPYTCDLVIS